MRNYPKVSVIILNWNGWKDTVECLESLYRITYPDYDVIVVDNGSTDYSIKKIREYCKGKLRVNSKFFEYSPKNNPIKIFEISEEEARHGKFKRPLYEKYDSDRRLILIKNRTNYGFAGGNNIGIKFALSVLNPEYILLLNNDTVVDRNFLDVLINAAVKYKDSNIISFSPVIYYYDNPDKPQYYGKEYFSPYIASIYRKIDISKRKKLNRSLIRLDDSFGEIIETELFTGAAVMLKGNIMMKVGLLDNKMFMGWEDVKYSLLLKQEGYRCVYVKHATIFHKGSVKFVRDTPFRMYQDTKNKIYTIMSIYSGLAYTCAILSNFLVWIPFEIFSIIYRFKNPLKIMEMEASLFRGIWDGIKLR
jgi:hypothetical protein